MHCYSLPHAQVPGYVSSTNLALYLFPFNCLEYVADYLRTALTAAQLGSSDF